MFTKLKFKWQTRPGGNIEATNDPEEEGRRADSHVVHTKTDPSGNGSANQELALGSKVMRPRSGEYYWRIRIDKMHKRDWAIGLGVAHANVPMATYMSSSKEAWCYFNQGNKEFGSTSNTSYPESSRRKFGQGDIIGVTYDSDLGSLEFDYNGQDLGECWTGITGEVYPCIQLASACALTVLEPEYEEGEEASGLTEEQLLEVTEAFKMFDRDGDGTLDVSELETVMKSLGQQPTKEEIMAIIKAASDNGEDSLTLAEFTILMADRIRETSEGGDVEKEFHSAFRAFDTNGDGYLSHAELKKVMVNLGKKPNDFTDPSLDEIVQEMIRLADIDGDGSLTYAEFIKHMLSAT
jgi:Ca2+-binding EF-hand superfamily protein